MVEFYKNKTNHPMFGQTHTKEALALISKPRELNPMFGKKHSETSKAIMSDKKNKYSLGIGIYDLDNNLISKFKNNVELAKHLNISKVTVGKYLNSGPAAASGCLTNPSGVGLVYNKTYYFKPIQD